MLGIFEALKASKASTWLTTDAMSIASMDSVKNIPALSVLYAPSVKVPAHPQSSLIHPKKEC